MTLEGLAQVEGAATNSLEWHKQQDCLLLWFGRLCLHLWHVACWSVACTFPNISPCSQCSTSAFSKRPAPLATGAPGIVSPCMLVGGGGNTREFPRSFWVNTHTENFPCVCVCVLQSTVNKDAQHGTLGNPRSASFAGALPLRATPRCTSRIGIHSTVPPSYFVAH